jgi:hypothetical protein
MCKSKFQLSLNSNSSCCYSAIPQQQSQLYNSPLTQHAFNINQLCPNFMLAQKYKFKAKAEQSYVKECSRIWNLVVKMPR